VSVAEHVGYGMVLGADGKPFSTREGTAASR
jgi:arginyl-tRNA synthetase